MVAASYLSAQGTQCRTGGGFLGLATAKPWLAWLAEAIE